VALNVSQATLRAALSGGTVNLPNVAITYNLNILNALFMSYYVYVFLKKCAL
jgi:hypothetical protein